MFALTWVFGKNNLVPTVTVALTSSGESSMTAMCLGMLAVRLCLLRSSSARIVDLFWIGVTFAQARWLGVMSRRMVQLSLVCPNAPSIIEGEAATILVDFRGFREVVAESTARVLVAVQGVDFLAVSIRESERMQV